MAFPWKMTGRYKGGSESKSVGRAKLAQNNDEHSPLPATWTLLPVMRPVRSRVLPEGTVYSIDDTRIQPKKTTTKSRKASSS